MPGISDTSKLSLWANEMKEIPTKFRCNQLTPSNSLCNRDSGVLALARCNGNRLHTQERIRCLYEIDEPSSELT